MNILAVFDSLRQFEADIFQFAFFSCNEVRFVLFTIFLKQTFFIEEHHITIFYCKEDIQIYYFQDILERFYVALKGTFHNT